MAKKGYIYKGLKTVYWCPHCETALAEAEIEYNDDKSFSIYVKFKSVDVSGHMPKDADPEKVFALIWTTTPGPFLVTRQSAPTKIWNTSGFASAMNIS